MSDDLVRRLRRAPDPYDIENPFETELKYEAADMIERLTAENKQLRADNERLRQALQILPFKKGFKE